MNRETLVVIVFLAAAFWAQRESHESVTDSSRTNWRIAGFVLLIIAAWAASSA